MQLKYIKDDIKTFCGQDENLLKKKVQKKMNRLSEKVLKRIAAFSIPLTTIYESFLPGGNGCMNTGSIPEYKEAKTACNNNRNHTGCDHKYSKNSNSVKIIYDKKTPITNLKQVNNMSFDDQYYILTKPKLSDYPRLIADKSTEARDYDFDILPQFSAPVFFNNVAPLDEPDSNKTYFPYPFIKTLTSFIVVDEIRNHVNKDFNLKGMRFHPAVYIVSDTEWHENYWYLNIYTKLDCWDRDKSDFDPYLGDDSAPEIDKYVLDTKVLNEIKENDRLIFRMGWDSSNRLFIHQRIIDYFESANVTGYRAFKVSEYEFGMEFRP